MRFARVVGRMLIVEKTRKNVHEYRVQSGFSIGNYALFAVTIRREG